MYNQIRSRLQARQSVVLDGPMGTELVRRGVRWRERGATILGGCCGTTPNHIAALGALR